MSAQRWTKPDWPDWKEKNLLYEMVYMGGGTLNATGRNLIKAKCGTTYHKKLCFSPKVYFSHSYLLWEILSLICHFSGSIGVLPKEGVELDIYLTHEVGCEIPLLWQCSIHSV